MFSERKFCIYAIKCPRCNYHRVSYLFKSLKDGKFVCSYCIIKECKVNGNSKK